MCFIYIVSCKFYGCVKSIYVAFFKNVLCICCISGFSAGPFFGGGRGGVRMETIILQEFPKLIFLYLFLFPRRFFGHPRCQ